MSTLAYYVRRALSQPPWQAARGAVRLVRRLAAARTERRRVLAASAYADAADLPAGALACRLTPVPVALLSLHAAERSALARHALEHRFDLLGSGWVEVEHGMTARGLEDCRWPAVPPAATADGAWLAGRVRPPSIAEATRLWAEVRPGYRPIDWHIDFKSGFRWPETAWHRDIRYGHVQGADVKVPWELGRLQHLPVLALAAASSAAGLPGFASPASYAAEIRDQVFDFLATNPPGFGVQWVCPMDVAIRAVNLVVTNDVLTAHGLAPDPVFAGALKRSVWEHGRFLASHLEWTPGRGNHYLCDLAGLLFCGAYLPPSAESDGWLAFGLRGLVAEVARQFAADGGNFEASTSYHRLSGEAVVYAAACVLGLPAERMAQAATGPFPHCNGLGDHPGWCARPLPLKVWRGRPNPFPAAFMERLRGIPAVSRALLRADATVPQFGDNDNGRLLKIDPAVSLDHDGLAGENCLDQRHLLSAAAGLLGDGTLLGAAGPFRLDAALVAGLVGFALPAPEPPPSPPAFASLGGVGVLVWHRPGFDLAVRCGANGQDGLGGHAHNDQLAIELAVGGRSAIVDAGTYLYTPRPEQRFAFRATAAHNTLAVEGLEQNRAAAESLFRLEDDAKGAVLKAGPDEFSGRHHGFGLAHERTIAIGADGFTVEDCCAAAAARSIRLLLHPSVTVDATNGNVVRLAVGAVVAELCSENFTWRVEPARWSPRYGVSLPTRSLVGHCLAASQALRWSVRVHSANWVRQAEGGE